MMKNPPSSNTQKALEFALKSVTAKRQTVKEMRERLQKRFPEADHDLIVERLQELEYLNDQAFSEAWIRHRSVSSPKGTYVLRQEMRRKGVQDHDMTEALEAFDEESVLNELAQRRWAKLVKEPNIYKRKEKLIRFLTARGFSMSNVLDVVNTLAETLED